VSDIFFLSIYDWCNVKCWKDLKYLVIIYFFIYQFLVYKIHLQKNHKLHSNLESPRLHSTTPLHLLAHASINSDGQQYHQYQQNTHSSSNMKSLKKSKTPSWSGVLKTPSWSVVYDFFVDVFCKLGIDK
jgi:hypothetical protein